MIDYSKEMPADDRSACLNRTRSVYLYAIGILLVLAAVAGALIWYTGNLDRELADATRTPATTVPTTTTAANPTTASKPTVAPQAAATAAPAAATKPASTPTTPAPTRVKVAKTEGKGANLRSEAKTDAAVLAAWPDGSVLDIVGPDVQAGGITWRQVKDSKGNTGYMAAEFLGAEE